MAKTEKVKTYNGGEWTDAKYFAFVKGGLRSASQRWPPKYKVLSKAYVGTRINLRTGRMCKHYACNGCGLAFPTKDVEVNHIIPVILTTGFDSWDGVISRLFCEEEGLEVLCKPCHKAITKQENEERKLNVK